MKQNTKVIIAMGTNCHRQRHTTLTLQQLTQLTKDIERMCGDTKEVRNHNIVNIDIDILQYGDTRLHVDDWNRPYIATLLKQLNP